MDRTYSIKIDGKQVMMGGFQDTAETLRHTFGVQDATVELVGEYYGQNGEDITVEIYG